MDDNYVQVFHGLVRETRYSHGYELPQDVEHYVVLLLADHVDRPSWQPQDSFAETYMRLQDIRSAKQLGDECLFLCGVFPEYGCRHGLGIDYYAGIGSSSYQRASRDLRRDLFDQLSQQFVVVSRFINATVRGANLRDIYR